MKSLVFLFVLLCSGFRLHSGLQPQSPPSSTATTQSMFSTNKSPSRFELKFQSELDNSTIIKREFQQQIFKCQVRLAPVSNQQTATNLQHKARLKYSITQIKPQQAQAQDSLSSTNKISNYNNISSNNKWQPSNVSLAIDWFKDNQHLDTNFETSLNVINVDLKSNTNFSSLTTTTRNKNDKTSKNSNKSRIEIKNTLNGNQLKLSSRLKMNQVKVNDSGRYKCIARASFQSPTQTIDENSYQSNERMLKVPLERQQQPLVLIEQTLESNGGTLLVKNTTELLAGQREETVVPEGEERKPLKVSPFIQDSSGKGKVDSSLHSNTGQPTTLLDNATSSILRLFQTKYTQTTNDSRHATTHREEVNSDNDGNGKGKGNTNKGQSGSQTGNSNQDSSNTVGNSNKQLDFSTDHSEANDRADKSARSEPNNAFLASRDTNLSSKQQQQVTLNSQFEDDEDLFKLDPDKIEFINSGQTNGVSFDDESAIDLNNWRQFRAGRQPSRSLNRENSLLQAGDGYSTSGMDMTAKDMEEQENTSEDNFVGSNNLSSSMIAMINDKNTTKINTYNSDYGNEAASSGVQNDGGLFIVNNYLGNSFHSTKLQISKFMRKITPELSCYTGNGEQYRGNVSITFDRRSCLNWGFIRYILSKNSTISDSSAATIITPQQQQQSRFAMDSNHNYCRNPTLDSRGPWCFVQYTDELDKGNVLPNLIVINAKKQQLAGGNLLELGDNFVNQGKFIQRHCPISACSEYLWVYIVAPPLGFLLFLSCLVAIFIRYVRKSYQNKSILFKATRRKGLPKFNKLIQSQASRFVTKKFTNCSSTKRKAYFDDDIFEIVDDIDWSDAQTHSLSPKSTESLKLNSSFSSSSNVTDSNGKHLSESKSINPLFNEKALVDSSLIDRKLSNQDLIASSRSVTQVGPMFATLRCQMRNQAIRNKSSTFIEQCDLATTTTSNSNNKLPPYVDRTNWLADSNMSQSKQQQQASCASSSPTSSSSSNDINVTTNSSRRPNKIIDRATNKANSYLISCSTTSEDIEKSSGSEAIESIDYNNRLIGSNTNCNEKFVKGNDLPLLNASSVSICLDQQPIYEGKFSHVRLAYIKQHIETSSSSSSSSLISTSSISMLSSNAALGHLGTQVAVCSLKSAALINPTTFMANNLKLRNLNHLNILKLIGYAQINYEIGGTQSTDNKHFDSAQQPFACSLVYDMAQLVDLNDWLKQQNKDTLTSDEPGNDLGIRRNLTCFAKQIALAIDYLHDRNIIFKDLACRNCFLDPTKMLVKLASFNIEFINFNSNDEKTQNLKSMIRPKYLLDYYVIDSRPSDCQLLPLSWIPLESILFNKFNKQTDIWSFGCLIYELFSLGEVAYFGYSSKQVIDAVRSNLMPPQPLLCPNGIYKLMCKCLSDIPTIRPTIKQTYEQLNLYSGQCSSFLDHHLCSLATNMFDDNNINHISCPFSTTASKQLSDIKVKSKLVSSSAAANKADNPNSIIKTKSYANIKNFSQATSIDQDLISKYDNHLITTSITSDDTVGKPEVTKIPLSRSINLGGNRSENNFSNFKNIAKQQFESNHYDEPIVNVKDLSEK